MICNCGLSRWPILAAMPYALGLITKSHKVEGEKQLSKASADLYIHTTVCT